VWYLRQIAGVPSIASQFRPVACDPANSSFQPPSAGEAVAVS
jgi:hypothetical protein